jgi:trimeric autotransporter adhesin
VVISRRAGPGRPLAVRVEPGPTDLERNRVQQLTARATFADGSERDVGDWVSWSSDDPTIARVNSTGLIVGRAAGTGSVVACWDTICAAPAAVAVR